MTQQMKLGNSWPVTCQVTISDRLTLFSLLALVVPLFSTIACTGYACNGCLLPDSLPNDAPSTTNSSTASLVGLSWVRIPGVVLYHLLAVRDVMLVW